MSKWSANRQVEAGRGANYQDGTEMTRDELAARLTDITGEHWTYAKVAKLETGRKIITPDIMAAVAEAQDLPFEFYLLPPTAKVPGRAWLVNRVIPGSRGLVVDLRDMSPFRNGFSTPGLAFG